MLTSPNHFIEPCGGVVLEECCTTTIVAFTIQAKEQVCITGCFPKGKRTSDITHAYHISCHCDEICDTISIGIALVDAVLDCYLYIIIFWVNPGESTSCASF